MENKGSFLYVFVLFYTEKRIENMSIIPICVVIQFRLI